MNNTWYWNPAGAGTSNSMYGNFPIARNTASASKVMNSLPNGQLFNQSFPPQNGPQPQMGQIMPTNNSATTPNTVPAPAQVTPAQSEQKQADVPVPTPQNASPPPDLQTAPLAAPVPAAPSPVPAALSPMPAAPAPGPAVPAPSEGTSTQNYPNANDNENVTIEYLHGDAAAQYLQQMQIPNDYNYQYQQSGLPNQPATNIPSGNTFSNQPYSQPQQTMGAGDNGISNIAQQHQQPTTGKNPKTESTPDFANVPSFSQPPNVQQQNMAPQPAYQYQYGYIQPSPAAPAPTQASAEATKTPAKTRKLQSYPTFVQQVSYECPPRIKPTPNPKPIQPQGKLTISAKRRMSVKPTFHLCGRCFKCKTFQSSPTMPNTVIFSSHIDLGKNTSMGRQVSTTLFPFNM